MKHQELTIDAKGRTVGRVAADVARELLGKTSTSVQKNAVRPVRVRVTNAELMEISEKKRSQKVYHSHSGYLGGDRKILLKDLVAKKGKAEALRRAVHGMIPGNTLRKRRLQNLLIEN